MVKLTSEQQAFVGKINNGYKPGKAALAKALAAPTAQQKQMAVAIKRNADMAIRQAAYNKSEIARKQRAKAMRKSAKKSKAETPELLTANMRVDYAKAVKKLAGKVAGVMNRITSDAKARQQSIDKMYNELAEGIKTRRARIGSTPLVRVTYITQQGYHQQKRRK